MNDCSNCVHGGRKEDYTFMRITRTLVWCSAPIEKEPLSVDPVFGERFPLTTEEGEDCPAWEGKDSHAPA